MIDPQQEFGFQESNYERPNREWECGWAAQGEPCHIGPDGSGICQAHRECVPYKEGDRYQCARPPSFGGKCKLGPRPDGICAQRVVECQPVRTLRFRRKVFTYVVAVLAVGSCLILFGGAWGKPLNSPGALTLQHHSAVQTCDKCHTAATESFGSWVGSLASTGPMMNDSQKCLVCHKELKSDALMAHGIDRKQLQDISDRIQKSGISSNQPLIYSLIDATARHPLEDHKGLACALCHHEHRGRKFDLTQMSNVQCQSCHTSKFHSFSDGHPNFTGFPYKRRTRLYFNHVTHYRVHFQSFERVKAGAVLPAELHNFGSADNPSSESCQACHQPDSSGKMMPVRGFEHACAACHGAEIEEDVLPGIELLAVPRFDDELLAEGGPAIGDWPKLTSPGDGNSKSGVMQVPPLMELLLLGDSDYAEARQVLAGANWKNLTEQQTTAVQRVAWSIKRLLYELVTEGENAGTRRLEYLNPILLEDREKDQLKVFSTSLFHEPTFVNALQQAQQIWFPRLQDEFNEQQGGAVPLVNAIELEATEDVGRSSSGWYAQPADGAIRYRVTGHADRLVKAVLDLAGRVPHLHDESKTNVKSATEKSTRESMAQLFRELGDPTAPQRCIGCHTVDEQDNGGLEINWVGRHVSPSSQSFTKFSHAPHLTLLTNTQQPTNTSDPTESVDLQKGNCGTCHWPNKEIHFTADEFIRTRAGYIANTNPHSSMTSGFSPLTKNTCAKCHTENLAGDSCLNCHNYHVFK